MSTFWKWFDATRAAAMETETGKRMALDGFELTHTGGGCTAWEKPIKGTDYSLFIASESSHEIDLADPDAVWAVMVEHNKTGDYSECKESRSTETILKLARDMEIMVEDGNFSEMHLTYIG